MGDRIKAIKETILVLVLGILLVIAFHICWYFISNTFGIYAFIGFPIVVLSCAIYFIYRNNLNEIKEKKPVKGEI